MAITYLHRLELGTAKDLDMAAVFYRPFLLGGIKIKKYKKQKKIEKAWLPSYWLEGGGGKLYLSVDRPLVVLKYLPGALCM